MFHWDDEDDDTSNSKSSDYFDFLVGYQDYNTLLYFCDSGNSEGLSEWPAGQYCILKGAQATSCPSGFSESTRYMDDEDDSNENGNFGEVNVIQNSGGENGGSTYRFCCRIDGEVNTEAVVVETADNGPPSFAVYPMTDTCQKFKYYSSKMVYIFHDNEDDDNNNQLSGDSNLPYGSYDENTQLFVCAYWKAGVTFSDGIVDDNHNVIDLDNPDLDPPANDDPQFEWKFRFDYENGLVPLSTLIASFLIIAFVCCRFKVTCRKRKKGKYGALSNSDEGDAEDVGAGQVEMDEVADNLIN